MLYPPLHTYASICAAALLLGCPAQDGDLWLGGDQAIVQQRKNTCGLAALAMILEAHGISASEHELMQRMRPGREGVSLAAIVATADSYGVRMESWRLRFDALHEIRPPAILWVDGDHFVVFDSTTSEGIFLRDPAKGRLKVVPSNLRMRWDGTAAVVVSMP